MNAAQELAAAVIAALAIPDAADADPAAWRSLLIERSGYVQGCLAGLADGETGEAKYAIAALRRVGEKVPVSYPVADGAGPEVAR